MTNPTKEKIESLSEKLDILVNGMKPIDVFSPEWDLKVSEYILLSLKISKCYESIKFM